MLVQPKAWDYKQGETYVRWCPNCQKYVELIKQQIQDLDYYLSTHIPECGHHVPWETNPEHHSEHWCPDCQKYVKHTSHEIEDDTPGFRMSWEGYECGHGHY